MSTTLKNECVDFDAALRRNSGPRPKMKPASVTRSRRARGKAVAIPSPKDRGVVIKAKQDWDPYEAGRILVRNFARAEGGSISRTKAAARLGIRPEELNHLIRTKRLVVMADSKGRFHVPVWQFGPTGILPGISDCLRHLGADYWGHMRFFLTPVETANGRTPLELLRKNRIAEAVTIARETSA